MIDTSNGREATTSMFMPLSKSAVFEHSPPRISYTALTSNSAIYNDVQINSTIELSSSQSCNQSFSSIDYPTGHPSYFSKNSPKTVTALNEAFLPLESSVTNCFKTYSASSDVPTLSFEKHFLWNTSLFCSQTRSIDQDTVLNPIIDNIIHRNQHDKILVDDDKKIFTKPFDNKNYVNQSNHSRNLSISSNNKSFIDEINSTHLTIKPNPYSIEEILKKPERNSKLDETIHSNKRKNDHEKPHSEIVGCNNHCTDFNSIHKKSRIKFKIYDINV